MSTSNPPHTPPKADKTTHATHTHVPFAMKKAGDAEVLEQVLGKQVPGAHSKDQADTVRARDARTPAQSAAADLTDARERPVVTRARGNRGTRLRTLNPALSHFDTHTHNEPHVKHHPEAVDASKPRPECGVKTPEEKAACQKTPEDAPTSPDSKKIQHPEKLSEEFVGSKKSQQQEAHQEVKQPS